MATRREQVLDAAVRVLGGGGARAFTHRAVDREAGLPPGTTSNYFRTRAALVDAVLDRLGELDQAMCESYTAQAIAVAQRTGSISRDELVELGSVIINRLLTDTRMLTVARLAITVEATNRPEVSEPLIRHSGAWWALAREFLLLAGAPVAELDRRARVVLAFFDGILLDQLARPDPDFDVRETLRTLLHGVLN